MHQLSHPSFRSTTLAGDLMQRMTTEGLRDWDDFLKVIPGGEVADLLISYRQTPVLLNVRSKQGLFCSHG